MSERTYTPSAEASAFPDFEAVAFTDPRDFAAHDSRWPHAKQTTVPLWSLALRTQDMARRGGLAWAAQNLADNIAAGTLIHVSSIQAAADRATVEYADRSYGLERPADGVAISALSAGVTACYYGFARVSGLDTAGRAVGDAVYLGLSGALTFSRPTAATNLIQEIGRVATVSAAGAIWFYPGARKFLNVPAGALLSGAVTLSALAVAGVAPGLALAVNDAGTGLKCVAISAGGGTITEVQAGAGLTGGGTSGAVSLAVVYGASAASACAGDDTRLSDARTPTAHTHPASQISDATTAGRAMLMAADAAAQRSALGLGAGDTPTFSGAVLSGYVYLRGDASTDGSVRLYSDAAGWCRIQARASGVWHDRATFYNGYLAAISHFSIPSDNYDAVDEVHFSGSGFDLWSGTAGAGIYFETQTNGDLRIYTDSGPTNSLLIKADGSLSTDAQIASNLLSGTAPLAVQSSTLCGALNADLLDGQHASAFASTAHTQAAATISDSTAAGRALLTAADAPAQRTALGLGDSAIKNVGTGAGTICAGDDSRLSNSRTPTAHAVTHALGGSDGLSAATAGASVPGDSAAEGSAATFARSDHRHSREAYGTTAGTICQGNDSRLSDARPPTAHASTHYAGASDALAGQALSGLRPADSPTFAALTLSGVLAGARMDAVAKTSAYALADAGDARRLFTNEGAAAQVQFTLPAAYAGAGPYWFAVQDAHGVKISAASGDTIRVVDAVSAAAGYAQSSQQGSVLALVAINATEWHAVSSGGVWEVA